MTAPLADQAARDRIVGDLDTTLVVEAAAGTGKTTALVARIVAALAAGRAGLEAIVAVTFTDAAAGELKLRLRAEIERARRDAAPEVQSRLTAALGRLEEARIGTLHAFCAELLRERPVEARIDPRFEVAPEDVARDHFDRAFDRWFEGQLANPSEAVRRILRRRASRDDGPREMLRRAAWDLVQWRDFPTTWRRETFDRERMIDDLVADMAQLGARAADGPPDDFFTRSLEELRRFVDDEARREDMHPRDYDGLEARLVEFSRRWHSDWKGSRSAPPGFDKRALLARRDALRKRLHDFVQRSGADLAPALRDDLWEVVLAYEDRKARAGCLDFLDLLVRARDLVRDNAAVRRELQSRFRLIFVDEFQDTDPLQAEILLLLAADDPAEDDWRRARPEPGKLFVVGDPQQSIYRFRRADVSLYERVKARLLEAGAALVHLSVSFRSVPDIQRAVNAAFAPRMTGASPTQVRYVELQPFRASMDAQPAIVALPVPSPYGDHGQIVQWRIAESLPDATAAFVHWVVRESGWTVSETGEPERRVPVRPRHVCLLFRRFRSGGTDVTRPYVRALEARGIPHVLVGGGAFHEREEVEALRNALQAIEWPDDELSVFATLRGPLFALTDASLLTWREQVGTLHPFRKAPEALGPALREVDEALAVLRELHRARNRRPFADTIACLLGATRAHAGLAMWPTGEQALANVARLLDAARRAERRGVFSFRGFVQRLIAEAERGVASDAPILEPGTEGVRIMTVHRAKGLEFPVVILADPTAPETPAEPSRWVDAERRLCAQRLAGCSPPELLEHAAQEQEREREEATRLLYVAATRARDVLVVPVVGDERREGWLAPLHPAMYPEPARAETPESRRPPGCPEFGTDATPGRPAGVRKPAGAVAPGLHRPEAGEHRVTWWDPAVLDLAVHEPMGLRQQKLLEADETGVRSEDGIRAHAAWRQERDRVRREGGRPSLRVVTATERSEALAASDAGVGGVEPSRAGPLAIVEQVPVPTGRPGGRRFGSLVHAVLSTVPLDGDRATVAAMAEAQGRILRATTDEIAAATESVTTALAHPLLQRAARAALEGRCRREVPVAMRLDDGAVLEGIADLAFLEEDDRGPVWTVVDFKTDAEIEGRLEAYRRQVALYADAIARATGRRSLAALLRV